MGKGSITADFFRLLKNDGCRYRNQAGTKMSDGHLISYRVEFVVRGLLYFSVAQARVILLNDLSVFKGFFEFFAVSGDTSTGIVSDIEVFGAAIAFAGIK